MSWFSRFKKIRLVSEKSAGEPIKKSATIDVVVTIAVTFLICVAFAFLLRFTEIIIANKLTVATANAATVSSASYKAKMIDRTASSLTMKPGETKTYSISFKNTGTATWKNSGDRFVSIYTMDSKYRVSPFFDNSWRKSEQPIVMKDSSVPSDTVGSFEFVLHAPKTAGTYTETFQVAAENTAWVEGGKFFIIITVSGVSTATTTVKPTTSVAPSPATPPATTDTDDYQATLLLRSYREEINLDPGETVAVILGFKNSGTKVWQVESIKNTSIQMATAVSFHHLTWSGPDEVLKQSTAVKPGEIGFFNFTLQAPGLKGSYKPNFSLVVDGVSVPGGEVDIPITVTADGEASQEPAVLPPVQLISEPLLRVGLYTPTKPLMIGASGDYDIYDGSTRLVESIKSGQISKIVFDFNYHTYTVTTPSQTIVLNGPVRFVPSSINVIMSIPSYSHVTGWNASLNDNTFRGTLELRYVSATGNLWVIDELPMEYYLRGLAETSNNSPIEFQKALATAARTYAFYHFSRNTKHGGVFHVDATYDQVYRGYGNEIRTPNFTKSVEATRGAIVTYGGEIAITPYYSRSDGRTRSWEEVWGGGAKPWLRSVPTPYDAGQTLWGHGVGMSARDAVYRADEGGASWDQIVKYYYTGIDLVKKWN